MSVPPPDVSADMTAAVLDDVPCCGCGQHAVKSAAQGGWLTALAQWFGVGAGRASAQNAARQQEVALETLQLRGPLLLNDMQRWLAFIEQGLEEGRPGWCAKAQELGVLAAAAHVHGMERLVAACTQPGVEMATLETQLARLRAAMPV